MQRENLSDSHTPFQIFTICGAQTLRLRAMGGGVAREQGLFLFWGSVLESGRCTGVAVCPHVAWELGT